MYYILILYLKFKLSNEKTSFVPRDNVIFYGISLKFMISQSSVRDYNIPRQIHRGINWDIIVYHAHAWTPRSETIWRSRAVVCNFVQNYRRFIKLTKDFQISNILKRKRQKLRYT